MTRLGPPRARNRPLKRRKEPPPPGETIAWSRASGSGRGARGGSECSAVRLLDEFGSIVVRIVRKPVSTFRSPRAVAGVIKTAAVDRAWPVFRQPETRADLLEGRDRKLTSCGSNRLYSERTKESSRSELRVPIEECDLESGTGSTGNLTLHVLTHVIFVRLIQRPRACGTITHKICRLTNRPNVRLPRDSSLVRLLREPKFSAGRKPLMRAAMPFEDLGSVIDIGSLAGNVAGRERRLPFVGPPRLAWLTGHLPGSADSFKTSIVVRVEFGARLAPRRSEAAEPGRDIREPSGTMAS
jgi:hypothetical protein